jgi:hypothetical protein
MKYKSCNALSLVIAVLATACSQSDWERLQMSPNSPVTYVAKNDDGDGFVVRERMFLASTEKVASILDSGKCYPFELYLSGDGFLTKYKGKTPPWYNPHGILLVSDLEKLFSESPKLQEDFLKSDEIVISILDVNPSIEILRYRVSSKGSVASMYLRD